MLGMGEGSWTMNKMSLMMRLVMIMMMMTVIRTERLEPTTSAADHTVSVLTFLLFLVLFQMTLNDLSQGTTTISQLWTI